MTIRARKHALWIRTGALGDLLIATAALEECILARPGKKFWIFGSPLWTQLIHPERFPQIEKLVTLDKTKIKELTTSYIVSPDGKYWVAEKQLSNWVQALDNCDEVINHRIESYRYALAPFFAKVPTRIGSCPFFYRALYSLWSPWLGKDPDVHERDWHLLTACRHERGFFTVRQARAWAEKLISQDPLFEKWRRLGLPDLRAPSKPNEAFPAIDKKKLILVNPTSSRREKAWPAERFLTLVGRLRSEFRDEYEIKVIGAKHESDWLNEVEPGDAACVQPASLGELINVVGSAKLLITNTSSMQFIAAGTKTPTITLMGRTNPKQWGPLGIKDVVIKGSVPENFSGSIFEKDAAALESMTVELVCGKIENYIRGL